MYKFVYILFWGDCLPIMTHIHIISKPNPGPKVEPKFRCVCCRKSTRNKPFKKCSKSASEGGRICLSCFEKLPDKKILDCHIWASSSDETCSWCSKVSSPIYKCCICLTPTCTSCLTRSTLELLVNKGHQYPVCIKCLPSDALGVHNNVSSNSFCLICLDHHSSGTNGSFFCPYDGTSTPPLVRTLRGAKLPVISPNPSLLSIDPSIISNPTRDRVRLLNLEQETSRSGSYCPSGPVGSEDLFIFKKNSGERMSSTSVAVSSGSINHNVNRSSKPPVINVRRTINPSRSSVVEYPAVEKSFQGSKSCNQPIVSKSVLKIPSATAGLNEKFKAIDGTASNLQVMNFMASISSQLKSMSDEVCSLKNSHKVNYSLDASISDDTPTCKGTQWSLKDQQFAKKTIPLSQSEVIAQQQAMISDLTKSMSSLVGSFEKKVNSNTSPVTDGSKAKSDKKSGNKKNKPNSKK